MNEITQIRTITDEDAAGFVSAEALTDLAELITSMPMRDDSRSARRHVRLARRSLVPQLSRSRRPLATRAGARGRGRRRRRGGDDARASGQRGRTG